MNLIVLFTKVYVFCYRKIHKITDQATTTPPGSSQNNPLVIIYRISDIGYPKIKPAYINNENCLRNAVKRFPVNRCQWLVIADNICEETYAMICQYIPIGNIQRVSIGHGAGTFRLAMNTALTYPDTTIVYFLEMITCTGNTPWRYYWKVSHCHIATMFLCMTIRINTLKHILLLKVESVQTFS